METTELASSVVQIIAGLSAGVVARAADQATNTAVDRVYALVQDRLGRSAEGRAALDAFTDRPAEPTLAEALQSALADAIRADPDFAGQLEQAAAAASSTTQSSGNSVGRDQNNVVITGGMRRSQFSFGPLTIHNTRTARMSLMGIGVALLLVLSLAGYGSFQLFTDDVPAPGAGAAVPGRVTDGIGDSRAAAGEEDSEASASSSGLPSPRGPILRGKGDYPFTGQIVRATTEFAVGNPSVRGGARPARAGEVYLLILVRVEGDPPSRPVAAPTGTLAWTIEHKSCPTGCGVADVDSAGAYTEDELPNASFGYDGHTMLEANQHYYIYVWKPVKESEDLSNARLCQLIDAEDKLGFENNCIPIGKVERQAG
ncbi:hypothetical protein [Streptomyces sp. V4I2]|uniref:hypothetical protein n=1 Tax=Streptomyces sp. V4I2 TaxID=3042280 RepID=UPI0027871E9D|nr:hypothetical protein [Streptomyces sp. V4I2]MDQ1042256.1 hypothetical protein [Streptomyces sp. V4I2]